MSPLLVVIVSFGLIFSAGFFLAMSLAFTRGSGAHSVSAPTVVGNINR